MIFEKELLSCHILDVLKLQQTDVRVWNSGRPFSALSYRLRSDASLTAAKTICHPGKGSVTYVPPGVDYLRQATQDELIAIHFDVADYQTTSIECFEAISTEHLATAFETALQEWNEKKPGYRYRCTALLYEILADCHIQTFSEQPKPSKIQNSMDYLLKEYHHSTLTIGEVAKRSFMSETYFRKLFKEEYGMSPQKYIVNLRIKHAIHLIDTGYYSLQEVATLSGYTDYKYFSVEFKRINGVSPSRYTEQFSK